MEEVESRFQSNIVRSAREPLLKNAILEMLSNTDGKGMDANALLQEISNNIKLEYKGLLYKCLQILARSGKLERMYSPQRRIVYRIKKE